LLLGKVLVDAASIHSLAHIAVLGPDAAAPWSRTGAKVCGGAAKLETALIFQSAHYTFQAYKPAGRAHVVTRGPACPAPFTRQPWLPRRSFKFQDLAAFEQRCHSAPPGQASTPFACRACAGLHLPTGGVGAHRMRHISPDHEVWRRFGTQARAACRGRINHAAAPARRHPIAPALSGAAAVCPHQPFQAPGECLEQMAMTLFAPQPKKKCTS